MTVSSSAYGRSNPKKRSTIPKSSPESVAGGIFEGLENGEEEIFPDPMSRPLAETWRAGPAKALERQNAALLAADPLAA